MKVGIYTDCHYSSAALSCGKRRNNQSLRKIAEAYAFFEREGCELVVCLGDLIDTEPSSELEIQNLRKVASVMASSSIPTVCLMGNHDAFVLERKDFYDILGLPPTEELRIGGRRLLFLDTCYFKDGRHYVPGDVDWQDCFLPDDLALEQRLAHLSEDTYIFMHQNIDPAVQANHRLFNADRVFAMINQSGVVKTVFQGHYHPGCQSVYDGVSYITLPAMCEREQAFWVYDI